MMRMLANKKNVKVVSLAVSAVFILGIGGLAVTQMSHTAFAAPASTIGIVDTAQVVSPTSPLITHAQQEMQAYGKQLQEQFEKESASMDDAQKQELYLKYQKQMQDKQLELQKAIDTDVRNATAAVAEGKGLTVVLDENVVLYGGTDITSLVAKKLEDTTDKNKK